MKISIIFEITKESLYAVHFEGRERDEWSDFFDRMTDVEYLHGFFSEHSADLKNGFYADQYGDISVEEAIEITLDEIEQLENQLLTLSKKGKESSDTLQTLFKPLNNDDYKQPSLQKNKATGAKRKSWLRIYAIRISANLFVVSGGAIKLTADMNDRQHLLQELDKLEATKNFLREQGVLDEDDYQILTLNLWQ